MTNKELEQLLGENTFNMVLFQKAFEILVCENTDYFTKDRNNVNEWESVYTQIYSNCFNYALCEMKDEFKSLASRNNILLKGMKRKLKKMLKPPRTLEELSKLDIKEK